MTDPADSGLVWNDEDGWGYLLSAVPVRCHSCRPESAYNQSYYRKYVGYSNTQLGTALTSARIEFVDRHYPRCEALVDIGIGSGQFVCARLGETYGYDVNPAGIRWLLDRGLWWDPWFRSPTAVTCWDSLEHMEDPVAFLQRVGRFAFVSLPIFRDRRHVETSKHFRPDEHIWYWTRRGLIRMFERNGFRLRDENMQESDLGREDIGTFAFDRIQAFPLT